MMTTPGDQNGRVGADRARRTIHGRRRGRKLRPARQRLIDDLLPQVRVPLTDKPAGRGLDIAALFGGRPTALWLEIGFGSGEHLAAQAEAHPDIGMIGCEPYINGVAALLARMQAASLHNIRIHPDDGLELVDALPDNCVERVFALFPDPWPKARQHKRRLISRDSLDALARIMVDNGELRLATDDPSYLGWILEHLSRQPEFLWLAEAPEDWRRRPPDWPPTRYEAKALEKGAVCTYLRYRRRPREA